eukprot:scpid84039/ scgid18605/ 
MAVLTLKQFLSVGMLSVLTMALALSSVCNASALPMVTQAAYIAEQEVGTAVSSSPPPLPPLLTQTSSSQEVIASTQEDQATLPAILGEESNATLTSEQEFVVTPVTEVKSATATSSAAPPAAVETDDITVVPGNVSWLGDTGNRSLHCTPGERLCRNNNVYKCNKRGVAVRRRNRARCQQDCIYRGEIYRHGQYMFCRLRSKFRLPCPAAVRVAGRGACECLQCHNSKLKARVV